MNFTNSKRRYFLKFIAGTPGLVFLPTILGLNVTGCGDNSSKTNSNNQVRNADEAAALVLSMAQEANQLGTFGVGGAIIENDSGRVIKTMRNKVLQRLGNNLGSLSNTLYINDPTAHGERQLVYWYYENKKILNLPEPEALTIVTSLEPCAMCAGTLLTSGFNVAVVAFDNFAGVNSRMREDLINNATEFPRYPSNIEDKLSKYFGYYAVNEVRNYYGAPGILFSNSSVSQLNADSCSSVFNNNVQRVRDGSNASGLDPRDPANQMIDPSQISSSTIFRTQYSTVFTDAFKIKIANYRRPDIEIQNYLQQLVDQSDGAKNAVALIDYFGNLLMAYPDRFDISPVATAFMTTVQNYSKLRFDLVNNPQTSEFAQKSLSSPKYGTFVFLHAPDGFSSNTLKDLGAYGSTMEGSIPVTSPSNFQFYKDPLIGSLEDLKKLLTAMPPFYGSDLVNISPERVR